MENFNANTDFSTIKEAINEGFNYGFKIGSQLLAFKNWEDCDGFHKLVKSHVSITWYGNLENEIASREIEKL